MFSKKVFVFFLVVVLGSAWPASAQNGSNPPAQTTTITPEQFQQLLSELHANEEKVKELEAALAAKNSPAVPIPETSTASPVELAQAASVPAAPMQPARAGGSTRSYDPNACRRTSAQNSAASPILTWEFGQDSNALIFPLGAPTTHHFPVWRIRYVPFIQAFKKYPILSAKLSMDQTTRDVWGLDIERLQVTYKPSPYFEISGGRYHTSVGYYNTTFHHGTWFQTATGRPFMYFFEDSGGVLPIHGVGVTTTGLVPGTGRLSLHWIAGDFQWQVIRRERPASSKLPLGQEPQSLQSGGVCEAGLGSGIASGRFLLP